MDDKKKTNTVIAEETNTAPVPLSSWEDKVRIHLFKDDGKYNGDMFVAVNGRSFQIQRGIDVDVPRCVAEVIEQSEKQDHAASMLMEKLEREYEQAT